MALKSDDLLFRGALVVASASLGINSYFIKAKVDEISADIRTLSDSNYQLRVESAGRDELINGIRNRLEVTENRLGNLDERVRRMEVRAGAR